MDREALIHFIGGAVGGTAGTAITCPLEVIKTRLQSSKHGFKSNNSTTLSNASTSQTTSSSSKGGGGWVRMSKTPIIRVFPEMSQIHSNNELRLSATFQTLARAFHTSSSTQKAKSLLRGPLFIKYTSDIIKSEGISALYKGLLPNLVGVAPSKAVYFYTYSSSKRFCNQLDVFIPDTAIVHMLSAGFAGFVTATVINPVWLVKTRLQLHHGPLSIRECMHRIYQKEGFKGYYKGVTASYMGISETIIQFVLYEHFRALVANHYGDDENKRFFNFMFVGGCAKFIACVVAYPHEVVRTRLREEGSNAKGFLRTLRSLYAEDKHRALYRGLSVQLLRSVPNTAITMGAYETVIYLLHTYFI